MKHSLFLVVIWAFGSSLIGVASDCDALESRFDLFSPADETVALAHRGLTKDADNTVHLALNRDAFEAIRADKPVIWSMPLLGPEGEKWELHWERFSSYKPDFKINRMTSAGPVAEPYHPRLLSYALVSEKGSGSMVLLENELMGTFVVDGVGYELTHIKDDHYGLFPLHDAAHGLTFECGVESLASSVKEQVSASQPASNNVLAECVEIALDVDYYTYGLFGSDCVPAVEWALAMLAGVHVIYDAELGNMVDLQATYVNVWEVSDPYAAVTNNGGGVLDAFRVEWTSNPALVNIPRDITHLLTRRTNTGTGGIAYLDVTCWQNYAFGLSSYLNGGSTYIPGTYAWNLNVVAHELGHNFGANHTHWCGWSTGPIDNCYDLEGSCGGYVNNPTAQVGTIMSYCHAVSGGSVNLQFHPTVENEALIPTINGDGSCFGGCATFTSSCAYYGCTDAAACNYDPEAVEDDGSCTELDSCGICGGDGTACIGCSDELACNYSELVTTDDGSCFYGPFGGPCDCGSEIVLTATLSGSEMLESVITGSGYISSFEVTLDFTYTGDQSWASEVVFYLESPEGACIEIGGYDNMFACGTTGTWPASWAVAVGGTYTATVNLLEPIGGLGEWTVGIGNGWSSSSLSGYALTVVPDQFCAFDLIPGCTDVTACNYAPEATVDDGTCQPAPCSGCAGDLNGDGIVSVADVLILLGDFGCTGACEGDANGDGVTNISDLLVLLAAFGVPC